MIILYYNVTATNRPTLQQHALFVGQLTGFTLVSRVSEYLYTSKSEHWLTTERVQFEMPDGIIIPAQQAHKHVSTTPIAVHIHIRTRKKQPKGTRPYATLSPRQLNGQILLRLRNVGTCYLRTPHRQKPILRNTVRGLDFESPTAVTSTKKHGSLLRYRLQPHIHPIPYELGARRHLPPQDSQTVK